MQPATFGERGATVSATDPQPHPLKALARKILERNRQRNQAATLPENVRNFTACSAPLEVARVAPPDAEVTIEATYGRVTCLRCMNLTRSGVCRVRSTQDMNYTPLQYEPVLLWRRCEDYTP